MFNRDLFGALGKGGFKLQSVAIRLAEVSRRLLVQRLIVRSHGHHLVNALQFNRRANLREGLLAHAAVNHWPLGFGGLMTRG